jgi:bacteriocin biosynthesis cyclodehydratase domain-containing protein
VAPDLPDRPKVADRFLVVPFGDDEYRFHSLTQSLSLLSRTPKLLASLLPLLDGEHTVPQILGELSGFTERSVLTALEELKVLGLLQEPYAAQSAILSGEELDRYRNQLTFFSHFAGFFVPEGMGHESTVRESAIYQEKLKQSSVVVYGLGRLGSQVVRSLALAGVGRIIGVDSRVITPDDSRSDAWYDAEHIGMPRCSTLKALVGNANPHVEFVGVEKDTADSGTLSNVLSTGSFAVLSADTFNPDVYDVFNLACLEFGTQWTSCRVMGFEFDIGPTVIPRETACFRCYDLRKKTNLTDYEEYALLEGHWRKEPLTTPGLPLAPGAAVAALEVIKALSGFVPPATYSHVFSMNLLSLDCRLHPILKVPRCDHCGQPSVERPTIHVWQQPQDE